MKKKSSVSVTVTVLAFGDAGGLAVARRMKRLGVRGASLKSVQPGGFQLSDILLIDAADAVRGFDLVGSRKREALGFGFF